MSSVCAMSKSVDAGRRRTRQASLTSVRLSTDPTVSAGGFSVPSGIVRGTSGPSRETRVALVRDAACLESSALLRAHWRLRARR